MGFSNGRIARIWSIEDKGNYSICSMSISRKNKETNAYETDFKDGFVRLVGDAHKVMKNVAIPEHKGVVVKLLNTDVSNVYTAPNGKVSYTPHYTVFGLETMDNGDSKTPTKEMPKESTVDEFMNIPDGLDEELPFA